MSTTQKRLAKHLVPLGVITAACAGALGFVGCSGEDEVGTCVSTEQYFAESIQPIISNQCPARHLPGCKGDKESELHLVHVSSARSLHANLEAMARVAKLKVNGRSELVLKPTNRIPHGGNEQITPGSEEDAKLQGL